MLVFDTENLELGNVQNAEEMPFEFKGVSKFNKEVIVEPKATCGCTVLSKKFTLKPNESFTIEGALKKRSISQIGSRITKGIKVIVKDLEDKILEQKKIHFNLTLVK